MDDGESGPDTFDIVTNVGAYTGGAIGAFVAYQWFGIDGAIIGFFAGGFVGYCVSGVGAGVVEIIGSEWKSIIRGLFWFVAAIFILWAIIHFWGVHW